MKRHATLIAVTVLALCAQAAMAQSSSLYATSDDELQAAAAARFNDFDNRSRRHLPAVHRDVPRFTVYFNRRPEPREFAINDLITIIVQESFESEMESEKITQKNSQLQGGINQFPNLQLSDLIQLQTGGTSDTPTLVDVGAFRQRQGIGEYERTETMTGRVRARIIDIKPNGMLVLEARRTIINDEEQSLLIATGNCMPEDISTDNTVVSNRLENLFIKKNHSGDLRETTTRGWLSRLVDTVFDF